MATILIVGGEGQVGLELRALDWGDHAVLAPPRAALDITDPASVARFPADAIINVAAHTAVDRAEGEAGAAFAANALGPAHLADAARAAGIPLLHVSTDYVFDGSGDRPYAEDDTTAPLSVYGASKRAGELAVLAGNPRSVVLRTAWVLSAHRTNFLKTMLRLSAERPELRVVADQIGCPTGARDIARALQSIALRLLDDPAAPTGLYHFVNAGETSWHGLAREIMAAAGRDVPVVAVTTADFPTPAQRPANSRLSTAKITRHFGIVPRPWQEAVREIVGELMPETAR